MMAIKSNGQVGIGTTDPISRLEILSTGSEMALYAGSPNGTGINASSGSGYGLFAVSQGWVGWFSGNVNVSGDSLLTLLRLCHCIILVLIAETFEFQRNC